MDINNLKEEFKRIYKKEGERCFFSPGRVNLIGEHIDYNGGFVFPCALEFGTYGVISKRQDNIVNLASTNFDLRVSFNIDDIVYKEEDDWANYPKGVIKLMKDRGYNVEGMDILISGNIPNGAGLSSSASLEVITGVIVNDLFNNKSIDMIDLVKISQEAENKFVGVNCGIMDQFAVAMGEKDKAIMLNCDTLEYSYAEFDLKEYSLIIMNTNKRRALNESKYNERRAECDEALDIIKKYKKVNYLCDLSIDDYNEIEKYLTADNIKNRAKHAIYENTRVKEAFKALNEGDISRFGNLLTESHESLKNLYEVTGKELDTIVDESLKVDGCIGARMTGAGFGGCAIAIVKTSELENFKSIVARNYEKKIGYKSDFYISKISYGTREI